LLIVNGDDWGGEAVKTDAIRAAYAAGAISGASAMVYMEDSDRAAALPRSERPPLGLHLNLTQPFADPLTPARVGDRHARLIEHFTDPHHRAWGSPPRLRQAVREGIGDQVARFEALYGAEPDHIDGHEHAHICLDVLLALPAGTRVRPVCSRPAAGRWALGTRLNGAARRACFPPRLRAPLRAYDIDTLVPELGGAGLPAVLALSGRSSVEIIVHPGDPRDDVVLGSDSWRESLTGVWVGSYADL
jgi:hypothetical protein